MPVISFANPKGGSGKTTSALLLAGELASSGGTVAIVDADPEQWISQWAAMPGKPANITIISAVSCDDMTLAVDGGDTLTCRATSGGGTTERREVIIIDVGLPTIHIASPGPSAAYQQGQIVLAWYQCMDARSGAQLWETTLPRRGNANPMTYADTEGRQYVVIVATDEVVAYRLP